MTNGHAAAISRASAYVSAEAAAGETIDGFENYLYIKELDKSFAASGASVCSKLGETAEKIFKRGRLTVCHSGERCDEFMSKMVLLFEESERKELESDIAPMGARREGIVIPAGIAFASMAGNVLDFEDKMHGSISVARSILSFDYLWNSIRVQGGAYGAGFIRRNSGIVGCYTYRDPNAYRSVEYFKGCADYLRNLAKSGESIENFIIGTIGDSEPLITPKVLSALSIGAYIRGESYEDRKERRREILKTSSEDLLKVADVIEKATEASGYCIVGGRDKIDAFGDKLDSIVEV